MRLLVPWLIALIATSEVSAQSTIKFEPPDPASTTPITLIVTEVDTCPPPPVVTRVSDVITVTLGTGLCLSPPTEITHRLEIGLLPAGDYQVVVKDDGAVAATATLTVLEASPAVTVQPSLGPVAGGTAVVITSSVARCASCPAPTITFGGVPATDVTIIDDKTFRGVTPPHTPGAVEVRVSTEAGEATSYAFRYYDPAAAPLPALFERVLVPVVYNGPGARGSVWKTEVSARNTNGYGVTLWRPTRGLPVIPSSQPRTLELEEAASGLFLVVPKEASEKLHMNVRVRDTSRESTDAGTELPIVREGDFSTQPFELLNVPRDPRYRTTLRIYLHGSYAAFTRVVLYAMSDGRTLAHGLVPLESADPCTGPDPCDSDQPSFAVVHDVAKEFHVPTGEPAFGIRIEPWGPVPLWAFVTLTNNDTQHVTVVSPQ